MLTHFHFRRRTAHIIHSLALMAGAVFLTLALSAQALTAPSESSVPLNQLQYIGSHNSYHAGLAPSEIAVWKRLNLKIYTIIDYSHPALTRQLDDGVRQIELDIFGDANGGRYAHPAIAAMAKQMGLPPDGPSAAPAIMAKPGFKVMHMEDIDQRSVCQPLVACLTEVRRWSLAHPTHLPVFILLETKDGPQDDIAIPAGISAAGVEPFDSKAFDALDAEIRSVFKPGEYLSPDQVRGDATTLNAAIRQRGWPTLATTRGKVIFLLDQRHVGPAYLAGHPSLRGRVAFTNAEPGTDDAAFTELNDGPAAQISELVKDGYLVRTRTDANLVESSSNDTSRRAAMMASGAQLLSTDFPDHEPAASGYVVRFPDHQIARCDPLFVHTDCAGTDLSH